MLRRKTLLVLSVALSVLLHAAFIGLAPQVPMLRIYEPSEEIVQRFRVRMVEDTPPVIREEVPDLTRELSTRPGSVEELLTRQQEQLRPSESLIEQEVSVPDMAQRVAAEALPREHALEPDETMLRKVDARIIEISRETARQDIQVARRHVRPSPMRILGDEEFPTMRTPGDDMPKELLALDPLGPGGGILGDQDTRGLGTGLPERERIAGADEAPEERLATLAAETSIGREEELAKATAEAQQRYEFLDDLVDIQISTYHPPGEREGYFRLRIVPQTGQTIDVLPKDVTFVIDASRSIAQNQLNHTVQGLSEALRALRPEDRFNIVVFRDTATGLERGFVHATPQEKQAALQFVQNLRSSGRTDIYSAIGPVVERQPREGVPGVVFFISDGQPSSGMLDSRAIINAVTEKNTPRNTVLAYGGGSQANQYLLDLLAFRNKGYSHVSPASGAIPDELPQFFNRFSDPILVDCSADYGRIAEENVFPKELPDFFKGQGVTVYGRYDPVENPDFAMRLTGVAGDRRKEVIFRADLGEAQTGDVSIAREWALRKIYYLIGEMTRVGPQPEIVAELDRLHREYGLQTSYSN